MVSGKTTNITDFSSNGDNLDVLSAESNIRTLPEAVEVTAKTETGAAPVIARTGDGIQIYLQFEKQIFGGKKNQLSQSVVSSFFRNLFVILKHASYENNIQISNRIIFILDMISISPQLQQQLDNNIKNYNSQDVIRENYNLLVNSYGLKNINCTCDAKLEQLLLQALQPKMSIEQLIQLLHFKDLFINQQKQIINNLHYNLSNLNINTSSQNLNLSSSNNLRKKRLTDADCIDCSSDDVSFFLISFKIQLYIYAYV